MSHYDDDYRGRSSHHRDRSPSYGYSGGAYPTSYEESRRMVNQGNPAYDDAPPLKQLTYEPLSPPSNLQVPETYSRPRSLPPPAEYRRSSRGRRGDRSHHRDSESEDSDEERARSPADKAKNFVDNTFSNSTAGLGIGVLGALVGGLAAREAIDATTKHNSHHEGTDHKRNQLIGTVVGAAVGALGANAVEKRIEVHRERDRIKQEKWERKFRPGGADFVEKREVVTRPRSTSGAGGGGGWKRDWDPWEQRDHDRARSRGVEREVDPDARSWRNVEDWLYDDRNDTKPRSGGHSRIAEEDYRY
ncbi:hypothetical protein F5Y04DRAFT_245497 [Hypomontagnella monticulosa]|nr:hypothetical protein F5Y04DRAFT_245497 [Hypomontagnella monticulosa]